MAEFNLDIKSLFERAFGIQRGMPYDGKSAQVPAVETVPEGQYTTDDDASSEGSESVQVRNEIKAALPTGRPIFMPIKLGDLVLPNEPSISIASRKNIVETALVGSTRRGTVKELIAVEDWQITIRGIALNYQSNKFYPEDMVKGLRDLYERNEALPILCALTNLMGIYRVVIRDFALPEMIGVQHAQAYQFTLTSDEDFILEI
jgi:hypothetical protein